MLIKITIARIVFIHLCVFYWKNIPQLSLSYKKNIKWYIPTTCLPFTMFTAASKLQDQNYDAFICIFIRYKCSFSTLRDMNKRYTRFRNSIRLYIYIYNIYHTKPCLFVGWLFLCLLGISLVCFVSGARRKLGIILVYLKLYLR